MTLYTDEEVERALEGAPYFTLSEEDRRWFAEAILDEVLPAYTERILAPFRELLDALTLEFGDPVDGDHINYHRTVCTAAAEGTP